MAYTIIKADLEKDADRIIDFWSTNFPEWPAEKFDWYYRKNTAGIADCWLIVESASGTIIGTTTIFPRHFYSKGETLLGGIAGDFAVDKQHRTLGAALALQKALVDYCRSGRYDFVYGYPNDRSRPVQKRAGFQLLGPASRLVRVLRIEPYLARYISNKPLIRILAAGLGFGMSLFARESYVRSSASYRQELLEAPDSRFDDLFDRAKNNFGLIGVRTNNFLTWRFKDCPYRKYTFFTLCRKNDNSLIGYIVYYHHDGGIIIADLFFETPLLLKNALLPSFLKYLRTNKFINASMVFCGENFLLHALKQYHFFLRSADRYTVILPTSTESINDTTCDLNRWFFLEADND